MRTVGIERTATVIPEEPLDLAAGHVRSRTLLPSNGALHFSTRGEYGVRLMVELARHYGHGPISLSEMAVHEDLPRPYLEQLVVSLRAANLVASTRGAHGGYQLMRDPAEIQMSQVITALEGPIAPMICASEDPLHAGLCSRTDFCNVNLLWIRVRDAVVSALESVSLADLARPRPSHPHHATALPMVSLAAVSGSAASAADPSTEGIPNA